MNTIMNLDNLIHIGQMNDFLQGSQAIAFNVSATKDERYHLVERLLKRFSYFRLKRSEKGIVMQFLIKVTGYSRQQLTRMISRFQQEGQLKRRQKTSNGFKTVYSPKDRQLLAELDQRHDTPNGLRVKKLCERAYHDFNEVAYERLAAISVAHIYNLRQSASYQSQRRFYEKTKPNKQLRIRERRKPHPEGKPGYIRIDTVHQGDLDGNKGVYHINAVDEVTQFEVVVSVEKISEQYLIPALEILLEAFPFEIINFHSDNGSEYINTTVAKLLNKLHIEMTKSRPRKSNDNALVEGKNAAIVRKVFGYSHIPQHFAKRINQFNKDVLNPYINYHRPCLFPTIITDNKGKQKKKYQYKDMMTPYEKFKTIANAQSYLRENLNFESLDDIAKKLTDNQAADLLEQQRKLLFKEIHGGCSRSA